MNRRDRGNRWVYFLIIASCIAAVALWRLDLLLEAWRVTRVNLGHGGPLRWKLIGEIVLFALILLATLWTIPTEIRPVHDLTVVLIAAAAGWAAEAWGTRLGLWRYYTGERPPLWIIPVWPLGTAMIDRIAARLRAEFGPAPEPLYWLLGATALGIALRFSGPWLDQPSGWAVPALVLAAVACSSDPAEDFWVLAAGMGAVFFADLWGVTNGCWAYDLRGRFGVGWGIAFGMAFDASTVLICLRLAREARD